MRYLIEAVLYRGEFFDARQEIPHTFKLRQPDASGSMNPSWTRTTTRLGDLWNSAATTDTMYMDTAENL